mgnify:CR=1 FL=1
MARDSEAKFVFLGTDLDLGREREAEDDHRLHRRGLARVARATVAGKYTAAWAWRSVRLAIWRSAGVASGCSSTNCSSDAFVNELNEMLHEMRVSKKSTFILE